MECGAVVFGEVVNSWPVVFGAVVRGPVVCGRVVKLRDQNHAKMAKYLHMNPTPEDRSRDKKTSPKTSINYLIFGDHGTGPIVSLKNFSRAYK